ncbi:MAG TPA: glycogen debranching N-terminal domain-containing protein [Gemmatimonadaceae bacterium]|nr:glycogen debranching N-terminal domain-containing protein [Gemmatimonadaceae bacterium]
MAEAVGYPSVDCRHGSTVQDAIVLKHDRLFLLLDPAGNIAPPGHCGLGLFHDDTRMLSHYALETAGGRPTLLSSQAMRMYSAQIDMAIDDTVFGGDAWNVTNAVHIRREILVDDALTERVTFTNFLTAAVEFWAELAVANDFADIFEVRGWRREARGTFFAPRVTDCSITFSYRGRDGLLVHSRIVFDRPPDEIGPRGARWRFHLEPHHPVRLEWHVIPDADVADRAPSGHVRRQLPLDRRRPPLEAIYDEWRAGCTHFSTNVAEFDAALEQATTDIRALYTENNGMPIISAGIPWYCTPFGRDSIITSLQTLGLNPKIAVDTLRYLARMQGTKENPDTEEQPGKIMHEIRRGELARAGEIPHVPYYGTIDATPLWLILLHETWRWTGDEALVREMLPHADRALEWMDRYGDMDGDGFIEYAKTSANGLVNQGWKDSWDGVPFPDGTLPEPPVALVEVQGYACDAKRRMAALYHAFGETERATHLRREAAAMRERIVERFWLEELGTFALALDGRKVPLPTVTSNAGHLLWSRIPDPARAARLASRLLAADMFSGWGLRTLGAAQQVYNPMSYHDGSVWPHDNAIVALGLSLCGQKRALLPIMAALHDAASGMSYHRLPELYCGMERALGRRPVLYPVSCSPQAWASGALFMLLQACAGILPDAPAHELHIREPVLPHFLDELVMDGLQVGGTRVALQFTRRGDRTLANLLDLEGAPLRVRIEFA